MSLILKLSPFFAHFRATRNHHAIHWAAIIVRGVGWWWYFIIKKYQASTVIEVKAALSSFPSKKRAATLAFCGSCALWGKNMNTLDVGTPENAR